MPPNGLPDGKVGFRHLCARLPATQSPPREPPGEPSQLPPLLSREVIHITFVGGNFRSSSIALSPHWQLMPDSVTDLLLGGNMASIVGDGGDRMGRALALLSYLP